MMQIWIDADACPQAIKQIIFRAAERRKIPTILVANQQMALPHSEFIRLVRVGQGADVADAYITEMVQDQDLVITADIPLAAAVAAKGARVLTPRGELYTSDNVGAALSMRNFMQEMRGAGLVQGGPPPMGKGESQRFAAAFDKLLASMR